MFEAKRITRSYVQTIHADPETVFPLLCPVREADWLDGWSSTMIRSQSGGAEEGAVFSTSVPGEADTIWIVTRHDPAGLQIDFARFTPGSRTCTLTIRVQPKEAGACRVLITYTYTGLTDAGNAFIERHTEAVFREMVQWWERSMNHYLRTGTKLVKGR